jgi:5-deoxy-D-glucuronate isomerase
VVESRQYLSKAATGEDIQLDKDDGVHVQPRGQFHKLLQPKGYHPFIVGGTIYKAYLGFVAGPNNIMWD